MKRIAALAFMHAMYLGLFAQVETQPPISDSITVSVDTFYSFSANTNFSSALIRLPEQKPEKWGFIKHVPNNLWKMAKSPFKKENLGSLALVAGATAFLVWQDHNLMNGVQNTANQISLDNRTKYNPVLRIGEVVLLKAPDNLNSALYQLGDGGTSLLLAGGLYIYGKTHHDNRALQAASDVTETVITMAIANKTIKWMAGRQEPLRATQPGGKWQPFTSPKNFWNDKSNYDAFCSGHVSTLTATVTVLSENFPEKKWIKPIGYSLVGMMAFALSNTQVHWVGDYPLAFALGYLSGKITASRHKNKIPGERSYIIP
jgi:hypothetical protein